MQVSKLADLVNYQDGSVVSKEIIKKETGTVTLFAFDKGQGLSEHTAPFDALVNIIDGQAEIIISGDSFIHARPENRTLQALQLQRDEQWPLSIPLLETAGFSPRSFIVKEGEMIIMPAHKPHALKATSKFKMLLVMVKS